MSEIKIQITALVLSLALVISAGFKFSEDAPKVEVDTKGVGTAVIETELYSLDLDEVEVTEQVVAVTEEVTTEEEIITTEEYVYVEPTTEEVIEVEEPTTTEVVAEDTTEAATDATQLAQSDIELIALITMAEAEGEPEEGKRLVIDTILNRVDHPAFPNSVSGVIYQANQFTCVWNGRVDRCYVSEEICQLVKEELASRSNYDVMFFCAGGYSAYGTPLFQVGHHYFSSY